MHDHYNMFSDDVLNNDMLSNTMPNEVNEVSGNDIKSGESNKNRQEITLDQKAFSQLFVHSIMVQKRLSVNTKMAYEKDLDLFIEFYNNALGDNLLQEFYFYLKQNNFSNATVARRISTVMQFMKFCLNEQTKFFDGARFGLENKPMIKLTQSYAPFMEANDFDKLRIALGDSKQDLRISAMMEVLYSTGMRISELLALKVECADGIFKNKTLLINGKGGHERYVFFNSKSIEVLNKYIEVFKLQKNNFLFQGKQAKPLTRQRVFQLLKSVAKRARINLDIVSPHRFRHRMLTDLVEGNADLVSVQKIAGHKKINTTARYIHVSDRLHMDIIEKHPLNDIIFELE